MRLDVAAVDSVDSVGLVGSCWRVRGGFAGRFVDGLLICLAWRLETPWLVC